MPALSHPKARGPTGNRAPPTAGGQGVGEPVGEPCPLGVFVCDGKSVGRSGVGDAVGLGVGEGVGDRVGLGVGEGVGLAVGDGVALGVGSPLTKNASRSIAASRRSRS